MSEEMATQEVDEVDVPDGIEEVPTEEAPQVAEPDYKELFEEQKRYSRQWERKCKDNAQKVKELEADAKKLQEQQEELMALRHTAWVTEASELTGVPKQVLAYIAAESKDDLLAKAKEIAGAYNTAPQQAGMPVILGDGAHVRPTPDIDANAFLRAAFLKNKR